MSRFDMSELEWSFIEPVLPNKPRGVARVNDRRVINGIFYKLRTGVAWRDLPERYGPYRRFMLAEYRAAIAGHLAAEPSITLAELKVWLEETHGVRVAVSTLDYFIRNVLSYPYKKTLAAAEREREDVKEARAVWQEWQKTCDPSKLVFLDETGTSTDMVRTYGRSAKGTRCTDTVPAGHWKTLTFIAGLRMNDITAPWVLDAAMTGEAFKTYLQTQLVPSLLPGDIVICDNLPAHKVAGVRGIIEAAGAKIMYLPPYSPDLNPIEQAFAKLKALLRKAAERSVEKLWKTIGRLLTLFKPDECKNYFKNSGYVFN